MIRRPQKAMLFTLSLALLAITFVLFNRLGDRRAMEAEIDRNLLSQKMAIYIIKDMSNCTYYPSGGLLSGGEKRTLEDRKRCEGVNNRTVQPLDNKFSALMTSEGCVEKFLKIYEAKFTHKQIQKACEKAIKSMGGSNID